MRRDALFRIHTQQDIRFQDNFLAGFDELGNPAQQVDSLFDAFQHLVIVVTNASDHGYPGFIHNIPFLHPITFNHNTGIAFPSLTDISRCGIVHCDIKECCAES
jgi:hypothetical protein